MPKEYVSKLNDYIVTAFKLDRLIEKYFNIP